MNFDSFLKQIPIILNVGLPGESAHLKMVPLERFDALKEENYLNKNPKKAAVMMLFYPKNGIVHLLLIIKNSSTGVHSSQVAFPGGKVELFDSNLENTALRETHEEIGVHPDKIKIIRPFSKIYVMPSNFLVFPFLGICNQELQFKLQEDEVADIIELPLLQFLDDNLLVTKTITTSYANSINVPCFKVGENYIWGATAMMLSELKEVVKTIL